MVVCGVSTRKVSNVVETLCGTTVSKSAVSEACKDLDKEVETFRNRPIEGLYPFLTVDATYLKIRENHRIQSKALMIAYGTNQYGIREVLGFAAYPNESKETWTDFLGNTEKCFCCTIELRNVTIEENSNTTREATSWCSKPLPTWSTQTAREQHGVKPFWKPWNPSFLGTNGWHSSRRTRNKCALFLENPVQTGGSGKERKRYGHAFPLFAWETVELMPVDNASLVIRVLSAFP